MAGNDFCFVLRPEVAGNKSNKAEIVSRHLLPAVAHLAAAAPRRSGRRAAWSLPAAALGPPPRVPHKAAGKREAGTERTRQSAGRTSRHAPSRRSSSQSRNRKPTATFAARLHGAPAERAVQSRTENPGSEAKAR